TISARRYRSPFANRNSGDSAAPMRFHFILHLHGLDDHDALAAFNPVAWSHQQAHNLSGHRRQDVLAIVALGGGPFRAPASRIGNRDTKAVALDRDSCAVFTG